VTAVDDARVLLESRLAAIEKEAGQIRRTLEHLSPNSGSTPTRKPGSTRRGGRKRAARGERQRQLVETIEKMPAATPLELADAIGVSSTQVHSMIRSLEGKSRVRKKGQGFEVIS
jgi:sugar-specific transcriptional regulator TrmB